MSVISSIFNYISDLGSTIMVPIMIIIVGLVMGCKPGKAIKAGITVGIGLIGLNLVMGLVWTYISPVADLLVTKFGLNLTTIDTGWATAAALAFSTTVGAFIIPFILLLNILLLALRATKTLDIDIWNYWHYAFTGAVVSLLTNNILFGFVAAAIHFVIAMVTADRTAEKVQKEMGLPGISIPQGFAVTEVPVFSALEKLYNKFSKNEGEGTKTDTSKITQNKFLNVLKDPIYLGLIIGCALAISVGYNFKDTLTVGISMAALMFLLPRMIKVLMEGLLPISQAAKEKLSKKYNGDEFYIGMDSAVLLGHPTTLAVGLILIPVTLVLAMILPWNTVLPVADLASTAYFVSMASVIHKGKFGRVMISGTVMMAIVLSLATFFAPQLTAFAATGAITVPEGAVSISALSAGNIYAFLIDLLFHTKWFGCLIGLAIIVALVIWNRKWIASGKATAKTATFKGADADKYVNK